jgi:hypothetical protein
MRPFCLFDGLRELGGGVAASGMENKVRLTASLNPIIKTVMLGPSVVNRNRCLFATASHKIEITDKFVLIFYKSRFKIIAVKWALHARAQNRPPEKKSTGGGHGETENCRLEPGRGSNFSRRRGELRARNVQSSGGSLSAGTALHARPRTKMACKARSRPRHGPGADPGTGKALITRALTLYLVAARAAETVTSAQLSVPAIGPRCASALRRIAA